MKTIYGKILSIKETRTSDNLEGFLVETTTHTIKVLISNEQKCCESWGYVSSEDDLNYFIGSNLYEIAYCSEVENLLETTVVAIEPNVSSFEKGQDMLIEVLFLNFTTNKGVFQLTVYNEQNGYYSHDVLIEVVENATGNTVIRSDDAL